MTRPHHPTHIMACCHRLGLSLRPLQRRPVASLWVARLGEPSRISALSFSTSATRKASEAPPPPRSPVPPKAATQSFSAADMRAEAERRRAAMYKRRNQSMFMYTVAVFVFGVGFTYAAVPLYRAFCSATGFSGTPMVGLGRFDPAKLFPQYFDAGTNAATKRIRVMFNADHSQALPWSFKPSQDEMFILPGETALAFFKARNTGNKDITGIATYNVAPDKIAPYFAKIECFCFEEQRLLANEEVDLPVFFFIDKDVLDDPSARDIKDVVLSYSFFAARRNEKSGQLEPDTDLESYTVGADIEQYKISERKAAA